MAAPQELKVSRLTSKGQVTVPKNIRKRLGLQEGDRVAFVEENDKIILKKASVYTFDQLADEIASETEKLGVTEADVLQELERVREELWNEKYSKRYKPKK